MPKFLALAAATLLLAACNTSSFSYPVSKFQGMGSTAFAEYVHVAEYGTWEGRNLAKDEVGYIGPKIAYFYGTDGGLEATKKTNGEVTYYFSVVLEYAEKYIRHYDTVTDMSGTKLKFKTVQAWEANGGYMREHLMVPLTLQQLEEAKFDGLFLTFAAKSHEKRVARSASGDFDLNKSLELINELNGKSNKEYKNNDNYDLLVPSKYIENFMHAVNS